MKHCPDCLRDLTRALHEPGCPSAASPPSLEEVARTQVGLPFVWEHERPRRVLTTEECDQLMAMARTPEGRAELAAQHRAANSVDCDDPTAPGGVRRRLRRGLGEVR